MSIIDNLRVLLRRDRVIEHRAAERTVGEDPFALPAERVSALLDRYDGYTWQGDLVKDLEWSESKTSRTLSKMEDEGRITRYQIGRRNVVCLPQREPDQLRTDVLKSEP